MGRDDVEPVGEGAHDERLGKGGVGLSLRDHPLLNHRRQHQSLAQLGRLGVVDRILQRVLRDGRQHGRLSQRQIAGRFAEVLLRGGLDAICPPAVEVRVDVPLEDLVFAVEPRYLGRQDDLFDLAVEGDLPALLRVHQHVAHQLLADRAGPLNVPAGQVVPQRAGHAAQIKARVFVEARVFDGDSRIEEIAGNAAGADPAPVAAQRIHHFVDHGLAGAVVQHGGQECFFFGGDDVFGGRQLGGVMIIHSHERAHPQQDQPGDQNEDRHHPRDQPAQEARGSHALLLAASAALSSNAGNAEVQHFGSTKTVLK